ncbi:MAG: hypothetical protein KQJ78_09965 [Deltaproteobacteria bacterium]|nr:hypothetical protein [Deltaproteobacteria bacterium]
MASHQIHRFLTPARLLAGSFACLILAGAALLELPFCQAGAPVSRLDCLFTAASAVCVTGLITVDTARVWSGWGQLVIAGLIQLGGLGIMTFSVALLHLVGKKPSARSHHAIRGALGTVPAAELGRLTRDVLVYTVVLEAVGAGLLYLSFRRDFPPVEAAAQAAFHAVSAFCNAGFSLFSNNLMNYRGDWLVNLVVMGLIVAGGLGFLVLRELRAQFAPGGARRRRLSLHTRLVLFTSSGLIVVGWLVLMFLEHAYGGGRVWGGSPWAALFLAITPRTAGFNTVDLNQLSNASLLVLMLLMFVGASPGSTGGGVKTTTVACLWGMAWTRLRGRPGAVLWRRSISPEQLGQALTLMLVTLAALVAGVLFMVSFGLSGPDEGHMRQDFLALAFETASALGTVGLSLGVTPLLTPAGKLVLIAWMFLGRLGPLTLIFSLTQRLEHPGHRPVEERISLG